MRKIIEDDRTNAPERKELHSIDAKLKINHVMNCYCSARKTTVFYELSYSFY